jgi:acetolactate synthase-1/2/3 large subunit
VALANANAVGALFTALGAESPVVLLSGHAATWELGRGGLQELDQAAMAAPVTKAAWVVRSIAKLAEEVGRAIDISRSGRPGPVHVSLPSDVLDAAIAGDLIVWPERMRGGGVPLHEGIADAMLSALQAASRPVILAGPHMSGRQGRTVLAELERATLVPAIVRRRGS